MNKEQAIEIIETHSENISSSSLVGRALDIAIDALKAQLYQEGTTFDLISRQAAIDALDFEIVHMTAYCDGKNEGNPLAQYNKGLEDGKEAIEALPTAQPEPQHERIFQEIVVEYPSYNTYPEYKGKPYFSIKYTENGQKFIGYGTYKPEVLSRYLKEYFMPPAKPEPQKGHWICVAGELMCSECRTIYSDLYPDYDNAVACPHCGAKMTISTK